MAENQDNIITREACAPKKDRTARLILSAEELGSLPEGTVVWAEHRNPTEWVIDEIPLEFEPSVVFPMVMCNGMIGNYREYLYPPEYDACDCIRMVWRYWDTKPTEEEQSNTPWPTWEECQKYWK